MFFPFGLAVDGKRRLIYVANASGNSISVYNTSGAAVTTIK
jgi:DNA-binding beta-propeller fold protein YncE